MTTHSSTPTSATPEPVSAPALPQAGVTAMLRPAVGSGDEDDLVHLVCCCNESVGICGADVESALWDPFCDESEECVVCNDLWRDYSPCPRCGCLECA